MQEDKKYLIVGGGLTGLSLAYHFYKNNIAFEVVTKEENFSSVVAAGLINPIVFRRTTKSWEVDAFLPYAKNFYQEIGQLLAKEIWHDLQIRRSFSHEQEKEDWEKKKKNENYLPYLGEINSPSLENLYQEYGTGIVKQAAWIDTNAFIFGLRAFFQQHDLLRYGNFDIVYDQLKIHQQIDNYKGVIFCEGYELINNPYFNYLPLDPTKGQTIEVQSTDIPSDESINRKCFVLPFSNELFRVGATYEWHDSSLHTTTEGRAQLEHDLQNLIRADYTVVNHLAGVRPTVKDRRPLLGQHPTEEKLYVFNGMGTKGYLIAPFMANEMLNYLIHNISLNKEIDIKRFDNR